MLTLSGSNSIGFAGELELVGDLSLGTAVELGEGAKDVFLHTAGLDDEALGVHFLLAFVGRLQDWHGLQFLERK